MERRKEYTGLDLGKFISSLLVLVIHVIPTPDAGKWDGSIQVSVLFQILARSAVPFFLVVSSYLLYKYKERGGVIKYIIRILQVYGFWFVINLPITIYFRIYIFKDRLLWAILNQIRAFFLTSTFPNSWFLMSCIFSAMVVTSMSKKIKKTGIIVLAFLPMELFCVMATNYGAYLKTLYWYQIFEKIVGEPQVSIFAGPFYFALGKWIFDNEQKITIKSIWLVSTAIGSYCMMIIEYIIARITGCYYTLNRCLFLIPFVFCISCLALRFNPAIRHTRILRKLSIVTFCTQWIYICALNVLERVGVSFIPLVNYFIVFILCMVTGMVLIKLSERKKYIWLKKVM